MSGTGRHVRAHSGSPVLLGVAVWALASACAGVRQGEGRVLIAQSRPMMLEEGAERTFVMPAPAASFTGVGALRELRAGDRVRYRWRTETAGVRLAEQLEAAPLVANDPDFAYGDSELEVALQQGKAPILVDTRTASEHQAGHLPGARSLPAGAPDGEVARALPADLSAPVVVYGEGPRDGSPDEMARRLLAAGVRQVRVLRAGIQGWTEADRWVEVSSWDARSLPLDRWLVVDVRSRGRAAEATPAGAISLPLDAFRWRDFDGEHPLPPILFVGSDGQDPTPAAFAEQIRKLRSAKAFRSFVQLGVLAGGFEAWVRAGLPVERGAALRTLLPYVQFARAEISPEEFERLWAAQGGEGARFLDVRSGSPSSAPWIAKIPLEELPARMRELPRDREIVVFCSMGVTAHVAAELLRANGFRARFLRAQSSH